MAKQDINLGTAPTGVGGDTPRSANTKVNANFGEVYQALGGDAGGALPAALPVGNGGTGGRNAAEGRAGLGLKALALLDTADIAHGGTGATTAAGARQALGLGSAATRAVGTAEGNVMEISASEIVQGNSAFIVPGSRFISYADGITTGSPAGAVYAAGIRSRYGDGSFFAIDIVGSIFNTGLYWRSVNASGISQGWRLIYDTTNTTRAADGTLKAV